MQNNNILLIGLGNIGKRHLEGVLKINKRLNIYIFDIKKTITKNLAKKINKKKFHKVFSLRNLNEANKIKSYKLIILSTTANSRADILNKIKFKSKYWLIEKPLAQSLPELNKIYKIFKNNKLCYVNLARENFKVYNFIKNKFKKRDSIDMIVKGSNWNLVSNSFHFIRLFEWINNSKISKIKSNEIKGWFRSKRKGYWEADGKIICKLKNGAVCRLISQKKININKNYNVSLNSKYLNIKYDEMKGKLAINNSLNSKIKRIPFVSEDTKDLTKKIYSNKKINLPNIKQSYMVHKKIIQSLLPFWIGKSKYKNRKIPVT